jgi:hypothetical protein
VSLSGALTIWNVTGEGPLRPTTYEIPADGEPAFDLFLPKLQLHGMLA